MIKFRCSSCDKKIGVPPEYAEKLIKCPRCKNAVRVPAENTEQELPEKFLLTRDSRPAADGPAEGPAASDEGSPWSDEILGNTPTDEQDEHDRDDAKMCPRCRATLREGSEFCVQCGHRVEQIQETDKKEKTPRKFVFAQRAAEMPLILLGGICGTLIGAMIWVGIVYTTGFEIGYAAVGIGVLAATGIRLGARDASRDFGALAVALAVAGLITAKLLVVQWVAIPIAEDVLTDVFADEIAQEDEVMFGLLCRHLEANGQFNKQIADATIENYDGEPIPPDLTVEVEQAIKIIWERLALLTAEQRTEIVKSQMQEMTENVFSEVTYTDKLKIAIETWYFDVLWFFFAIMGAYKIGSGL